MGTVCHSIQVLGPQHMHRRIQRRSGGDMDQCMDILSGSTTAFVQQIVLVLLTQLFIMVQQTDDHSTASYEIVCCSLLLLATADATSLLGASRRDISHQECPWPCAVHIHVVKFLVLLCSHTCCKVVLLMFVTSAMCHLPLPSMSDGKVPSVFWPNWSRCCVNSCILVMSVQHLLTIV